MKITSLSQETRTFHPPEKFVSSALIKTRAELEKLYEMANTDAERFWKELAQKELIWDRPFDSVLNWRPPFAEWFTGGTLNASVQALDRHKNTPQWHHPAIHWFSETGEDKKISYKELYELTCKTANALTRLGVKKGEVVTIYMPLVPEAIATMLACSRIGAIHSVVFAGFSAEALKDRLLDAKSKVVVTADGARRRGQIIDLKSEVDKAVVSLEAIEKVLVFEHVGTKPKMNQRDILWKEIVEVQPHEFTAAEMQSEDPLFILYTSGTTGKPKGISHTTAGYLLWTKVSHEWVFDIKPSDVYWCTADIGWITGHSYLVYGPLQNGCTCVVFEGAPNYPDWGQFWRIIEKSKTTIFYTAPTAIRACAAQGDEWPQKFDLSSLRLLGTVGEPINPEAWMWFYKIIGNEKCPIVDTWWQTETGGIMIAPIPAVTPLKPGSCTKPLPGIQAKVLTQEGNDCETNHGGLLVVDKPWPSMLRGIWGDPQRFEKTYWSQFKAKYFTGDGARIDSDGFFWLLGRVDDVLNVSGHRLSTAEIESALVAHASVAESAVVARPDDLKGQAIVAFVSLKNSEKTFSAPDLIHALKGHVVKEIGALARPEEIIIVDQLPKTRSGKIMRRLLREIATHGKVQGDLTTLENANAINEIIEKNTGIAEE